MKQSVLRARKEEIGAETGQDQQLRPSPSRRYVPGTNVRSKTNPPNLPPSTKKCKTSAQAGLHRPSSIPASDLRGSPSTPKGSRPASYLPQSASSTITKRIADKSDSIRTSTNNQPSPVSRRTEGIVAITSKPDGLDSASNVAKESTAQVKDYKASTDASEINKEKQKTLKDSDLSARITKPTSAKFNRRERGKAKANASERGTKKPKSAKTTPKKGKACEPMTDKARGSTSVTSRADNVTARRVRPASLNSRGYELTSGRPAKGKSRGGTSVASRADNVTNRRVRPASLNTRGHDLASGRTVTGNKLSAQTGKKLSVQTGKKLAVQSGKTLTPQTVPNRKKPRNVAKIGRSQSMHASLRSSTQNKILRRNSVSTPRVKSPMRAAGTTPRRRAEVPIRRRNSIGTTNSSSMNNRGGVGPLKTRHQQSMKTRQPMTARNNNSSGSGVRIRRSRTSTSLSRGRGVSDRRRSVPRMDTRKDNRSIPIRQKKQRPAKNYLGNRKSIKDRVKKPIQSFGSSRLMDKIDNMQDHVWPHGTRIEF